MDLGETLFAGRPTSAQQSALTQALVQLSAGWGKSFMRVNVALPDALGWLSVWPLERLPRRAALRRTLARWRLASELRLAEEDLECDCQALGPVNGQQLLLGQALDRRWLECVRQSLRDAGIVPWRLNQAFYYRFNLFHPLFTRSAEDLALLSLDPDCWSVLVADSSQRIRFMRSAWRHSPTQDFEQQLVDEVERSVLAYVGRAPGQSIQRLYVTGAEPKLADFVAALNRGMKIESVVLDAARAGIDMRAEVQAGLSLTAALAS